MAPARTGRAGRRAGGGNVLPAGTGAGRPQLRHPIILWALGHFIELPANFRIQKLMPPGFTGMVLAAVCILQFALSVLVDWRYEPRLARTLYWIIWYPLAYWMVGMLTTLLAFPKVMLKTRRKRARWTSPDRGIHTMRSS